MGSILCYISTCKLQSLFSKTGSGNTQRFPELHSMRSFLGNSRQIIHDMPISKACLLNLCRKIEFFKGLTSKETDIQEKRKFNSTLLISEDYLRRLIGYLVKKHRPLKVRQFQNEFMKSSFLPKYEQIFFKISSLTTQGRNPDYFLFVSWEKR